MSAEKQAFEPFHEDLRTDGENNKKIVMIHLNDNEFLKTEIEKSVNCIVFDLLIQSLKPPQNCALRYKWEALNRMIPIPLYLVAVDEKEPFSTPFEVITKQPFPLEAYDGVKCLHFALINKVNIRHRGKGNVPNFKNAVLKVKSYSSFNKESLHDFLVECIDSYANGESVVVNEEDQPITSGSVFPIKSGDFNVYISPAHSSYSTISFPAFFSRVRTDIQGSNESWLFLARAQAPTVLSTAMKKVFSELQLEGKAEEWKKVTDEVYHLLKRINRVHQPSNNFKEQSRRLLIDAVLLPVVDFANRTISVETEISTAKDKNSLGWGPLDYITYGDIDDLLFKEGIDEPTVGKRKSDMQESISKSPRTEAELNSDDESETQYDDTSCDLKVGSIHYESKKATVMDSYGAVQTGSQMYDNHNKSLTIRQAKEGSTIGCLTSGHEWLYFHLETVHGQEKPHFSLLGEVSVSVLRATTTDHRPSLMDPNDHEVSEEDTAKVALAAYTAFKGALHRVPFK